LPQKAMTFFKREGWKHDLHIFAFTNMQDITLKQRAQEICKPDDMHSAWKIWSLLYSVVTSFIWRLFLTSLLAYVMSHISLQVFSSFSYWMMCQDPGVLSLAVQPQLLWQCDTCMYHDLISHVGRWRTFAVWNASKWSELPFMPLYIHLYMTIFNYEGSN
jgi:hypothetical protein